MATATALARARPAKTTRNPTPTSQVIGPEGPKHPGNRQLYDKRGCPDTGAPLCGNHADTKVATFCTALSQVVTLAEAGDIAALQAIEINPVSSSPKAMARYRDLCVIAIAARMGAAA